MDLMIWNVLPLAMGATAMLSMGGALLSTLEKQQAKHELQVLLRESAQGQDWCRRYREARAVGPRMKDEELSRFIEELETLVLALSPPDRPYILEAMGQGSWPGRRRYLDGLIESSR